MNIDRVHALANNCTDANRRELEALLDEYSHRDLIVKALVHALRCDRLDAAQWPNKGGGEIQRIHVLNLALLLGRCPFESPQILRGVFQDIAASPHRAEYASSILVGIGTRALNPLLHAYSRSPEGEERERLEAMLIELAQEAFHRWEQGEGLRMGGYFELSDLKQAERWRVFFNKHPDDFADHLARWAMADWENEDVQVFFNSLDRHTRVSIVSRVKTASEKGTGPDAESATCSRILIETLLRPSPYDLAEQVVRAEDIYACLPALYFLFQQRDQNPDEPILRNPEILDIFHKLGIAFDLNSPGLRERILHAYTLLNARDCSRLLDWLLHEPAINVTLLVGVLEKRPFDREELVERMVLRWAAAVERKNENQAETLAVLIDEAAKANHALATLFKDALVSLSPDSMRRSKNRPRSKAGFNFLIQQAQQRIRNIDAFQAMREKAPAFRPLPAVRNMERTRLLRHA